MRNHLPQVQLPKPRVDEWEWQLKAACRSMPIGMFFPARGLRGHSLAAIERDAKLVCAQCPIIDRCLTHALETKEPYGIWGGLTALERLGRTSVPAASEPVEQPAPKHRIGPPKRYLRKVPTG